MLIYPSLIAANQLDLRHIITICDPWIAGYHIDIMDNHFVPNITVGADLVNTIGLTTKKQLWVHLMIENPLSLITQIKAPASTIIDIHIETKVDIKSIIKEIKKNNWIASLAINPQTTLTKVEPFLDDIDQILIMSVEPGFYGQFFLNSTYEKIHTIVQLRKERNHTFAIAVDGGINQQNISQIAQAKVDRVAIGSGIFKNQDIVTTIKQLKEKIH